MDINVKKAGHVMNITYANRLLIHCRGLGNLYDPNNTQLSIANLEAQVQLVTSTHQLAETKRADFSRTVSNRENAFDNVKKLCTRILAALEASNVSEQIKQDARTHNRKVQGYRKKKSAGVAPLATDTPTDSVTVDRKIKSTQLSYVRVADNLSKFKQLLAGIAAYQPKESDLTVTAITAKITELETLNTAAAEAYSSYAAARINRLLFMYVQNNNLVDNCQAVKKYLKSVFGANGPKYKQVSNLKFTKFKK